MLVLRGEIMSARDSLAVAGAPFPCRAPALTWQTLGRLALLLLPRPAPAADDRSRVSSYLSDGKAITVEQFLPAGNGRYPTLLMLHGAGGLEHGDEYRKAARLIAERGYAVFLVHYFD